MREPSETAVGSGCVMGDDLGPHMMRLRPRMTSVAMRFAPNRDIAEDIVQSAYEKALRYLSQFRGHARFSTWLHRIVVNESLMWLRAEKRRSLRQSDVEDWDSAEWTEPSPDPSQLAVQRQRSESLWNGLARLPREERDVLVCCALREESYEDFGARRGLRPAAVKSRAFRGRQKLRSLLAEPAPHDG